MFAITLIMVVCVFVAITGIILVLMPFFEFDITLKTNRITTSGDLNLSMKYEIGIEYNDFLCFYIPTLETKFESNKIIFEFNFSLSNFYIGFNKYPADIINTTVSDWLTVLTSMGSTLGLCGGGFGMMSVAAYLLTQGDCGVSFSILNVLWTMNLFLAFQNILKIQSDPSLVKYGFIGMSLGLLIGTAAAIFPSKFAALGRLLFGPDVAAILKGAMIILGTFGIDWNLQEKLHSDLDYKKVEYLYMKCMFSLYTGSIVIILGSTALSTIQITMVNIVLALMTFSLGLIFLDAGISY
jgi:hypothetical protein